MPIPILCFMSLMLTSEMEAGNGETNNIFIYQIFNIFVSKRDRKLLPESNSVGKV